MATRIYFHSDLKVKSSNIELHIISSFQLLFVCEPCGIAAMHGSSQRRRQHKLALMRFSTSITALTLALLPRFLPNSNNPPPIQKVKSDSNIRC